MHAIRHLPRLLLLITLTALFGCTNEVLQKATQPDFIKSVVDSTREFSGLGGRETIDIDAPLLQEENGYRPLKLAISGDNVAILSVPVAHTSTQSPSRISLYNHRTRELQRDLIRDGKESLQLLQGYLDYKNGNIALNSDYLGYCREAGEVDPLVLRRIDAEGRLGREFEIQVPDGLSCTNPAANNYDDEGIAFVAMNRFPTDFDCDGGALIISTIFYQRLGSNGPIGTPIAIDSSRLCEKRDPANPYLFNRGVSAYRGTLAWVYGGHDDAQATIKYWDGQRVHTLALKELARANIQGPVSVSLWDGKILFHAFSVIKEQLKRRRGVAMWEPSRGELRYFSPGQSGVLIGDFVLSPQISRQRSQGVHRYTLERPKQMQRLTQNRWSVAPRASEKGLFVYLHANSGSGAGAEVRIDSLWRGDLNLDGGVDELDLAVAESKRGKIDINQDGRSDAADFELLSAERGAQGVFELPAKQVKSDRR